MRFSVGGGVVRWGRQALVALLVVLLTTGSPGVFGAIDRASADGAVTIVAINALNGNSVPNVKVVVAPSGPEGATPIELTTNSQGQASATLPSGSYFFGLDGTETAWVLKSFLPPVEVGTAPLTVMLDLVPVAVTGRVVYEENGQVQGVDGVFAQIFNKDHTVNIPGTPGSDGAFKIGGITEPGTYYLQIQPPFFDNPKGLLPAAPLEITVTQSGDGTLLFVIKGVVDTPTPAPITLPDITMRAAAKKIVGTIERKDGKDLGATMVNAFPADGGGPGSAFFNAQATVSGSKGTFTLAVPPGTWQVNVNPDFGSNRSADWIYSGQPVTVSFAKDETPEEKQVSFVVTNADYTLTAQVKLPDGSKPPDNSVFIHVHNRSGFGRGEPVIDGVFSMRVPAGTYEVEIFGGNGQLGPPKDGIPVLNVPDPANPTEKTIKLGTNGVLELTQRTGTITGKVMDQTGGGLPNIHVNAWNPTTNDHSFGQSGSDGSFTLYVGDGSYDVDAFPGPDAAYSRQGGPQRVTVKSGTADKSPTFTMASASATVTVQAVDANGNVLTDANGFAFAMKADNSGPGSVAALSEGGHGPGPGGKHEHRPGEPIGNGQPLINGVATLRLPAADGILVGIGFPPGSSYLFAQSPSAISTKDTASQTVKITLSSPDVTIKGKLLNGTTPVTGVRAQVFAMSQGGGSPADVDQATGEFTLKVQSGRKWFMGLFLPPESNLSWFPSSSGPAEVDLTSAASGSTVEYNFSVTSTDGTVTGTVKDPSGAALSGAFVAVLVPSSTAGKPPRFIGGGETDSSGQYTVRVPSGGTYQVEAHIAPEKGFQKGYIAPAAQSCTSWSSNTCTLNFQFKTSDATISGSVTDSSGAAVEAFVRAWSDSGGNAFVHTASDGTFTLNATAGDAWHLQAIQETGGDGTKTFAISPVKNLTTSAGANAGNTLILGTAATLPTALTTTFDATSLQVLTLSNGVKLTIPAGALATSGQVTVRATPKPQLPANKTAQPLDIGYALEATDSNGSTITKFNANVTIEIPYDVSKLGSGTSEEDLVPSYYDTATGTWKKADNVTIDATNDVAIILVDHFTDFAVLATTQTRTTQTSHTLYIPVSLRGTGSGW